MTSYTLQTYVRRASIILALGLVLASLTFPYSSNAVTISERITFPNILENKDITLGESVALLQDSPGFMWLGGSNALIRYDGCEFREMFLGSNGTQSNIEASVKTVQNLFEDRHRFIGIATITNVRLCSPVTEKIVKLNDRGSQTKQISTGHINRIGESPTGRIIACSTSGFPLDDEIPR